MDVGGLATVACSVIVMVSIVVLVRSPVAAAEVEVVIELVTCGADEVFGWQVMPTVGVEVAEDCGMLLPGPKNMVLEGTV